MSLEEIASAVVGLIFIVLIAGILICLGAAVYFHFTETPQLPQTVPTAEEVQQIPPALPPFFSPVFQREFRSFLHFHSRASAA
jgi:hypothetical protein